MRRDFTFSVGEFYHVYNRGTDKRIIFQEDRDYRRFLALLYVCNGKNKVDINQYLQEGQSFSEIFFVERGERLVDIGVYAIMPNHFHLLLRERTHGGVSSFMKKVGTAYSMYFNKKYKRTGGLFEGRFKAKHANFDEYLKYLFAYIHLNPVALVDSTWSAREIKKDPKIKDFLRAYQYSSYIDYLHGGDQNPRLEKVILNREFFPKYFDSGEFEKYTDEWLSFQNFRKDRPSLRTVLPGKIHRPDKVEVL